MLKCQRQQHRGVSCDGLDVFAGLAAVDEDLAQCAVIEEADSNDERLIPVNDREGLGAPSLRKGSPGHGRALAVCTASPCSAGAAIGRLLFLAPPMQPRPVSVIGVKPVPCEVVVAAVVRAINPDHPADRHDVGAGGRYGAACCVNAQSVSISSQTGIPLRRKCRICVCIVLRCVRFVAW